LPDQQGHFHSPFTRTSHLLLQTNITDAFGMSVSYPLKADDKFRSLGGGRVLRKVLFLPYFQAKMRLK